MWGTEARTWNWFCLTSVLLVLKYIAAFLRPEFAWGTEASCHVHSQCPFIPQWKHWPQVSILSKGRIDSYLPGGGPAESLLSAKLEVGRKCFFKETMIFVCVPPIKLFKEASFTLGKINWEWIFTHKPKKHIFQSGGSPRATWKASIRAGETDSSLWHPWGLGQDSDSTRAGWALGPAT